MLNGGPVVSLDVSAVPDRPAGAGRYTLDLVRELADRQDVALTLLARTGDAGRWASLAPRSTVLAVAPGPRPARLVWEQLSLPGRLERLVPRPDVHHGPHYTMPERARLPRVVTIHDLTFFDHPEWHERTKAPFFRRAIRVAAARADAVICVSEATAARLTGLVPTRAEVRVVPHGVDHTRFRPATGGRGDGPAGEGPDPEADRAALAAVGVEGPYVAFLGTSEPRKGLDVLLAAFDRVAPDHQGLSLVVAGGHGWGNGPVREALGRMRHRSLVVRTGYLDDDVVPALLRRARVVAYPSRAEGFGLPVLEALACGAPVVTTAGSVMEDVAGDAAVLVAPDDAAGLAEALEALLGEDPSSAPARARRQAGLAVAARHTWQASAAAHVGVYRRLAGR